MKSVTSGQNEKLFKGKVVKIKYGQKEELSK